MGEANLPPYPHSVKITNYKPEKRMFYCFNFTTEDQDLYEVQISNDKHISKNRNEWHIGFAYVCDDYENMSNEDSDTIIVNKGRVLRIMSTIVDIMKLFISLEKPKKIIIVNKNADKDPRRLNIYRRIITKNLPFEYRMTTGKYSIILTRKTQLEMVNERIFGIFVTLRELFRMIKGINKELNKISYVR
jgi:hypothetical protein